MSSARPVGIPGATRDWTSSTSTARSSRAAIRFPSDSPIFSPTSATVERAARILKVCSPPSASRRIGIRGKIWLVRAANSEKTEFSVVLESAGDKKINVIKVVRELTGLGLKEAKDLVEGAPKEVKGDVPKSAAEEMKKKLEAEGAKVALK